MKFSDFLLSYRQCRNARFGRLVSLRAAWRDVWHGDEITFVTVKAYGRETKSLHFDGLAKLDKSR